MSVADTGPAEGGGDSIGFGQAEDAGFVVAIDKLDHPVEVDGAGDVAGRMDRPTGPVGPPADVDQAQVRLAELIGQPVGRGDELGTRIASHAPIS